MNRRAELNCVWLDSFAPIIQVERALLPQNQYSKT